MIGILVSDRFPADAAQRIEASARKANRPLRWLPMPADPAARIPAADTAAIAIAFFTEDIFDNRGRAFFSAVRKAPNLRWLQTFSAGVDHPIFTEMLDRGVRLTTATGMAAVPIAQSAITGLLMLARGFPAWIEAQRQRTWNQVRALSAQPLDLAGQTLCVVGLGSIGREIARLAQALGMQVIGIRRSPRTADDSVTEVHPPAALGAVLPCCQWLALACPLTAETRKLLDAPMLARLPRGARLINVARGEIVDESALIAALERGDLAGAYLDVFEQEPLPAQSPLWALPNVIVTPHNSGASQGNNRRLHELFIDNFDRWLEDRPLRNEVARPET